MKTQTAKRKKYLYVFLLLLMFALNWAALHDIAKNKEPDLTSEYAIVIVSVFVIAFGAYYFIRRKLHNG